MQTFLPYSSFNGSIGYLDKQRLGKQRVECVQILNTLLGKSTGWKNHPAVKMWRGYEPALLKYFEETLRVWKILGFKNTKCELHYNNFRIELFSVPIVKPTWLGDERLHRSHRSNLLRKNFDHYSQWFDEPLDLPYFWPVT